MYISGSSIKAVIFKYRKFKKVSNPIFSVHTNVMSQKKKETKENASLKSF